MQIRRFNDRGIDQFQSMLSAIRKCPTTKPDWSLCEDIRFTDRNLPPIYIDRPGFATKRDAAVYLRRLLEPITDRQLERDGGLWTWLSLYFLDDICPLDKNGERRVLNDYHYIYFPTNMRWHYRHLLSISWRILLRAAPYDRLFLDTPINSLQSVVENTVRNLYLTRIPCIYMVLERLYLDPSTGKVKPRAIGPHVFEGDLSYRLPRKLRQLEKTFDLHSLSADQLFELLGSEFTPWLEGRKPKSVDAVI